MTRAITRIETKDVPEKPNMDDQNKTFRTRLVAMWILTNAGLAVAIENINGLPASDDQQVLRKKENTYFAIILYSTFGLAAVRFIGVCFSVLIRCWYFTEKTIDLVSFLFLQTKLIQMFPQKLILS